MALVHPRHARILMGKSASVHLIAESLFCAPRFIAPRLRSLSLQAPIFSDQNRNDRQYQEAPGCYTNTYANFRPLTNWRIIFRVKSVLHCISNVYDC